MYGILYLGGRQAVAVGWLRLLALDLHLPPAKPPTHTCGRRREFGQKILLSESRVWPAYIIRGPQNRLSRPVFEGFAEDRRRFDGRRAGHLHQ
jgi:hypothetical protein